MAAPGLTGTAELGKEMLVPEHPAGTPTHGPTQQSPGAPVEEQGGIPIPGLLQVTECRQPLSSVSSLEVHFDLLDLTELTDMSDQELAEVFADSDEENTAREGPGGGAAGQVPALALLDPGPGAGPGEEASQRPGAAAGTSRCLSAHRPAAGSLGADPAVPATSFRHRWSPPRGLAPRVGRDERRPAAPLGEPVDQSPHTPPQELPAA
ncbi:dysbindin domain-containing protein 1-like isoform 1-T1 [Guaruba guarouba]